MTARKNRFSEANIHDSKGRRKYLTSAERSRFRASASSLEPARRDFCLMLLYTGARISEVLELSAERIDAESKSVVIRTLKRRNESSFRAIPLPVLGLNTARQKNGRARPLAESLSTCNSRRKELL